MLNPSPFILGEDKNLLTISELSLKLKRYVEEGFKRVRIKGEISGFKRHTSGHSYFALKDDDAVLDAVMWRGTPVNLQLADGLEVIATGRITTYPGRSKYQIVVDSVEAYGAGALMKLLLERKAKLEAEGVFSKKRPLPSFPRRIGIITSPTGAVIQDILHRLQDRYPCEVILWPVLVQGPGASEQVTEAINGFNKLPLMLKPDVLIVARGGGSFEDLWTFNEENVVRAAYMSEIPLISAIGHETDTTLIDFAADVRAPTPTAAAELATPVRTQLLFTLKQYQDRINHLTFRYLGMESMKIQGLSRGLVHPRQILENAMQRLDDRSERLHKSLKNYAMHMSQRLKAFVLRSPIEKINFEAERMAQSMGRLNFSYHQYFESYTQSLNFLGTRLKNASYKSILERGFCWVEENEKVIAQAEDFPLKVEKLSLHFFDGVVSIQRPEVIEKHLFHTVKE